MWKQKRSFLFFRVNIHVLQVSSNVSYFNRCTFSRVILIKVIGYPVVFYCERITAEFCTSKEGCIPKTKKRVKLLNIWHTPFMWLQNIKSVNHYRVKNKTLDRPPKYSAAQKPRILVEFKNQKSPISIKSTTFKAFCTLEIL